MKGWVLALSSWGERCALFVRQLFARLVAFRICILNCVRIHLSEVCGLPARGYTLSCVFGFNTRLTSSISYGFLSRGSLVFPCFGAYKNNEKYLNH